MSGRDDGEETYTIAVTLTRAEARAVWSFSDMLQEDLSLIRAIWTWHPDPEVVRQMERELDAEPAKTRAVLAAAITGFRKVSRATTERFGPDVKLGPRRLLTTWGGDDAEEPGEGRGKR